MNLRVATWGRRGNEARVWAFSALILLAVPAANVQMAQAATNVVYNKSETDAGSLRQVIQKSLPGDSIIFSNLVTGTITLTNGELLIAKSLTILGPGTTVLAVSGNTSNRVFNVTNSTVNISGLTIRDGKITSSSGQSV